jgi:heme/copper-type cytochrome/quinol oxidase subunit 2
MKNKIFVILTMVVLSLFIMGCNETVEELPIKPEGVPEQAVEEPIEEPKPLVEDIPEKDLPIEMKIIKVTGENYKFVVDGEENPEIKVKVGEMIKIEFTSTDGFHDFVIDELNAKTERVTSGKSTVIEFVADKAGTFSYYCSVGNHRSAGMVGNFMVE